MSIFSLSKNKIVLILKKYKEMHREHKYLKIFKKKEVQRNKIV